MSLADVSASRASEDCMREDLSEMADAQFSHLVSAVKAHDKLTV